MAQEPWEEFCEKNLAMLSGLSMHTRFGEYHKYLVAHGWHKDEPGRNERPIDEELIKEFFENHEFGPYCNLYKIIEVFVEWLNGQGIGVPAEPEPEKKEAEPKKEKPWEEFMKATSDALPGLTQGEGFEAFYLWLRSQGLFKGDAI